MLTTITPGKVAIAVCCGLLTLVAIATMIIPLTAPYSEKGESSIVLFGKWKNTSSEERITATVSGEGIEIFLNEVLYWSGSFPLPEFIKKHDSFEVVSVASEQDLVNMEASIFGSQDSKKYFKVCGNEIWFQKSMLGRVVDVYMKQS